MLYKRELINSFETIGYSCCIMMSIVYRPKWSFHSCCNHIGLLGTGFMQVMSLGRAPRTKETLPDFRKRRRVTRHPLVFRRLTGSQRTPGNGASQLGIRAYVYEYLGLAGKRVRSCIHFALMNGVHNMLVICVMCLYAL